VSERSEVQFGLTKIPFEIRRSGRKKTVALAVDNAGDVTVTAPAGVPRERLEAVVRTKAPWIVERVKRASDRPPPSSPREFVTGETVLYLGRHYRLKLSARAEEAVLKGGWLIVPGTNAEANGSRVGVASWLRRRAEVYLPTRLAEVCRRHRIAVPPMLVGEQRARWGSCDARGSLRINWRIVQAPIALVDYVLLHEVTHLVHPSHDRVFWSALGRRMPNYEARRDRLREVGPSLVW
jgi:predicted metal-dependent hydrolase